MSGRETFSPNKPRCVKAELSRSGTHETEPKNPFGPAPFLCIENWSKSRTRHWTRVEDALENGSGAKDEADAEEKGISATIQSRTPNEGKDSREADHTAHSEAHFHCGRGASVYPIRPPGYPLVALLSRIPGSCMPTAGGGGGISEAPSE